jgi:hypothetical protein
MPAPLFVTFSAGSTGPWRVERISPVIGESLASAPRLMIAEAPAFVGRAANNVWSLRGATGNTRYTTKDEVAALTSRQEGLGRPAATCAALIPIRKSEAWWALAQDERRAIFEDTSRHIAIGLDYLPGVARRLHHARELGEPFDFLTWFEYAPDQSDAFEDLVARLRATEEWRYVEREVDVRLVKL